MRNLKKFLAVILAVTVMLTAMVPAFAAGASYETQAETLNALKLMEGSNGDLMLDKALDRQEGVTFVLALLGLKDDATAEYKDNADAAKEVLAKFKDSADVSDWALAHVAYAVDHGIIKGSPDGNFYPKQPLKGKDFASMIMNGLGFEDENKYQIATLLLAEKTDGSLLTASLADDLNNVGLTRNLASAIIYSTLSATPVESDKNIIELLVEQFPELQATAAEAELLPAITVVSFEQPAAMDLTVGDKSEEKLPKTVKATMSDGTTKDVTVTWPAVSTTAAAAKATIEGTVEGTDVKAKIDVTVKVKTNKVESVTVDNLREVVIKYNMAVGDAGTNKDNYKVNDKAVASVSASEDKTTVTLVMANADFMSNYKTDNKIFIAKAVGFEADQTINSVVSKDVTVPTLVKAETTGPRNIKLTFSEPLDSSVVGSNAQVSLKLDNGTIAIDTVATGDYSGRTLTIKALSDLAAGSHTIEVIANKNLKDNAGYAVQAGSASFTYAKDTTALTATVDSSNETSVTLKFNKAIDFANTITGNTKIHFSHTYKGGYNTVGSADVTKEADDKIKVSFGSTKPFPPGTTTVYLTYDDGATKIKDFYGNELGETSWTVTTTADTTKPTVTAEFVDATHVKVVFNEDVDNTNGTNGATNTANYTLKSGSDTIAVNSVAAKDGTSKKEFTLTTATINGGTLTLTVKNVKDVSVAANKIDDTTLTIAATDKVAPTTDSIVLVADKKLKVKFSEAMDVATVTDKSLYRLGGVALDADDKVEAIDSNKAVLITFKNTPTTGTTLTVGRVKDAAGNWSDAFQSFSNGIPLLTNVGLNTDVPAGEITSKTTVKLTIDDVVTGATTADFVYSNDAGSTWGTPSAIATNVVDGKTYITLTIAEIANTTGANVRVATYDGSVRGNASANMKNGFDQKVAFITTANPSDKIAPTMNSAVTADSDTDGKLDRIAITFSENIYIASVQDTDFTLADGYEVESIVSVLNNVVTIAVKEKDNSGNATPKVKLAGVVEDAQRNATSSNPEVTPTDGI